MRKSLAVVLASLVWSMPALSSELTITVTQGDSNEPVSDAVVYLDRVDEVTPITAEVYQKDRAFHPDVLILPVGSLVEFPNRDNTQHHVYSFSPAKPFNIELYADKPEAPVLFDTPGIVELGCNIHDHMQAFIIVTNTIAIGQTNDEGRVTLTTRAGSGQLPIKIWHPRLPDNTRPILRQLDSATSQTLAIDLVPKPAMDDSMDLLQQRFREL
ncbi:methylamine utilization protein [Marinobacter sp. F4206]|uniref:methylamine utilization protein n=1 Tax=Marinobacter sp. F4206 TaxID=2861777 RepID=UPI001C5D8CE3|nr:methylamine utilization protein [Marinobacter sp. F4206]MBW4935088.1 methylamine utilization protein [Marinobacter sp. F4206]